MSSANVTQFIAGHPLYIPSSTNSFARPLLLEVLVTRPADVSFAYDLTLDEARRRAAVLEALGDDWDPIEVLADEQKAYEMLYSDLDDEQQRIYDELVKAGVLPDRTVDRVTD